MQGPAGDAVDEQVVDRHVQDLGQTDQGPGRTSDAPGLPPTSPNDTNDQAGDQRCNALDRFLGEALLGDFLGDNCGQIPPTGRFWRDFQTGKSQLKPNVAVCSDDPDNFTSASLYRLSYSGMYAMSWDFVRDRRQRTMVWQVAPGERSLADEAPGANSGLGLAELPAVVDGVPWPYLPKPGTPSGATAPPRLSSAWPQDLAGLAPRSSSRRRCGPVRPQELQVPPGEGQPAGDSQTGSERRFGTHCG